MPWNWQQSGWGEFTWSASDLSDVTRPYREKLAHLEGMLVGIHPDDEQEIRVEEWVAEAVSTSLIEGVWLNRADVRSSIRQHLGLAEHPEAAHDLRAIGVSRMLALSRHTFDQPLTESMLGAWQAALFDYRTDLRSLGQWRAHPEPMQILSGPMGREKVHFEAPPSGEVPSMMAAFLEWFNQAMADHGDAGLHPVAKAGVAHLWFESVHPFEDGNGRVGRAVAEKALAQDHGRPLPFSLSLSLEHRKKEYYAALESAQRSGNEVTPWLRFFASAVLQAVEEASERVRFVIRKVRYLDAVGPALNDRQYKALLRMFEAGPAGFEGGMNVRKYMGITRASKATATRDLQELVRLGALVPIGQGKGVRYEFPDFTR